MDYKIKREIAKCALCHEGPCSAACSDFDAARIIRSLYFDNAGYAAHLLPLDYDRKGAQKAMNACPEKTDIPLIFNALNQMRESLEGVQGFEKVSLETDICGIRLENPFMLSSSVVSCSYEMCARAFKAGWAGACFKTISAIDIHEASPRFSAVKSPLGKFYGFKNIEQLSEHSIEENAETIRRLKQEFPDKVLIVSIMGRNEEEWEMLARRVTEAGADIVECNFSCPNMEEKGTGSDVGQDAETVERYTRAVRRGTKVPVLAKMTPNITDMRIPAEAALTGGADGIAAINTVKSITGVNIDTLVALPQVRFNSMSGGYSGVAIKPIALRFITELCQMPKMRGRHISGMGGIETWRDALEFILLGAGSVQVTTAVMEYGVRIIDDLIAGLKIYMAQRNYSSVKELTGLAAGSVVENDSLERNSIVYPIIKKALCTGCGRCFISCRDGGHQALVFDSQKRDVRLNAKKCVGCHLCLLVCHTGAIRAGKRIQL